MISRPVVVVVWNSQSGVSQNASLIDTCLTALAQQGELHRARVEDIIDPATVRRKFPINRCTHIIAIGGDGTVSASANIAVLFKLKLLVVPTGTFNHFAVHLGIPRDVRQAFTLFESGKSQYVDVGRVNDRLFVNFISLGYYTDIIRTRILTQRQGSTKWGGFMSALLRETFRRKRHELLFTTASGEKIKKQTPLLFIGNGVFHFGSADILAGRKSFTANKVHIAIFKDYSRLRLFFIALASMVFDTTRWLSIENYPLTACTITDPHCNKFDVSLDGEVVTMHGELSVQSLPRALQIILPKESSIT